MGLSTESPLFCLSCPLGQKQGSPLTHPIPQAEPGDLTKKSHERIIQQSPEIIVSFCYHPQPIVTWMYALCNLFSPYPAFFLLLHNFILSFWSIVRSSVLFVPCSTALIWHNFVSLLSQNSYSASDVFIACNFLSFSLCHSLTFHFPTLLHGPEELLSLQLLPLE